MTWQRINLADEKYAVPPQPPRWGLIYEGKRHKISGPPESAKTLLGWVFLFDAMRDDAKVAALDFELGPEATRLLLTELGFSLDEIAAVHYFEPDSEPGPDELAYLTDNEIDLVLIDALAGAYEASMLDDNKRKDVEKWQRIWTKPLYRAGIATLLVDHVVKNSEARGDFSIGSERKAGTVDVHLGLEVTKHLARGTNGLYKAHIRKDRPAFLRAGGTRDIELISDPATHRITWKITETGSTAGDHWQPTILMERVSEFLEEQPGPVTRNTVERNVRGKSAKYVRKALDELIANGYVAQTDGPRNSKLVQSIKPYRAAPDSEESTASDRVPTASDAPEATDDTTASTASTAYRRDAVTDAVEADEQPQWGRDALSDEELERLSLLGEEMGLA